MILRDSLSRINTEVPGCPPDLIVQQLLDVIRDFCRFTRAWTYEVENETILKDVSDYEIELPSTQAYPIAIEFMELDGAQVYFKARPWLDQYITNWRKRSADDFRYFTQLQPKQFTFPCVPTKNGTAGALRYIVSLMPADDATTMDDTLGEEFIECWSCGAKARLRAMPDKPWSNSKRASELEGYYRAERAQARIRAQRSFGNAADRWNNPRGFA